MAVLRTGKSCLVHTTASCAGRVLQRRAQLAEGFFFWRQKRRFRRMSSICPVPLNDPSPPLCMDLTLRMSRSNVSELIVNEKGKRFSQGSGMGDFREGKSLQAKKRRQFMAR